MASSSADNINNYHANHDMIPPPPVVNGTNQFAVVDESHETDKLLEDDSDKPKKSSGGMSSYAYSEQRRRQFRLSLSTILSCIFFGLIAVLAMWRWNQYEKEREKYERLYYQAAHGLFRLNKHAAVEQAPIIPPVCTSTLLLMRQCEHYEPPHFPRFKKHATTLVLHCNYLGNERAAHLTTLFGNNNNNKGQTSAVDNDNNDYRWKLPSHLYAYYNESIMMTAATPTNPSNNVTLVNLRYWETLQPLSEKANVVTQAIEMAPTDSYNHSIVQDYFSLLQSGTMCNKVTVIAWLRQDIPEIARNLGCGPNDGCTIVFGSGEHDYETIWELQYTFHGGSGAPVMEEQSLIVVPPVQPEEEEVVVENDGTSSSSSESEAEQATDGTPTIEEASVVQTENGGSENTVPSDENNTRRLSSRRSGHTNQRRLVDEQQQQQQPGVIGWTVTAKATKQHFDPLSFSTKVGDYPIGGINQGGKWQNIQQL